VLAGGDAGSVGGCDAGALVLGAAVVGAVLGADGWVAVAVAVTVGVGVADFVVVVVTRTLVPGVAALVAGWWCLPGVECSLGCSCVSWLAGVPAIPMPIAPVRAPAAVLAPASTIVVRRCRPP
jgi:hypothetical protein